MPRFSLSLYPLTVAAFFIESRCFLRDDSSRTTSFTYINERYRSRFESTHRIIYISCVREQRARKRPRGELNNARGRDSDMQQPNDGLPAITQTINLTAFIVRRRAVSRACAHRAIIHAAARDRSREDTCITNIIACVCVLLYASTLCSDLRQGHDLECLRESMMQCALYI